MKDNHIIDMLENSPLASLTARELLAVRSHAENCQACRRAYDAAQLATLLIKERAAEAIEPSPFFQTRVLAALREQQANNAPVLWRLWKSAGALVSSMALTTASLAVLSFVVPGSTNTQSATAALIPSSAEAVVFNQDQTDDQMTDDQVLNTIYEQPDEGK
jgi:predicted anti-sigma-YlaC factor YlaD